jgi:hypothetical protein
VTNVILQITDFIEPCGRNCKEHADSIQTEILEHQLNRGKKVKNVSALGEGLRFVVIPVMGCSEYDHDKAKNVGSNNGGGGDEDGDYMISSSLSHILNKSLCYCRL